ncbi:Rha family transcriptional regulator [Escherichia coli]|nr:Rha family transcriptional regulator [Escherichia coli]EFM4043915.1 Rha family transcriptional regulator [Escherichia coli]EFN1066523.1 Rha family transcriptional regulator [Escherichia coli]EHC8100395.1 Rha family transcriptional regulator [Escherichia coli]EIG2501006.1 Rha family transcriptional regulator [Escherichia coli]
MNTVTTMNTAVKTASVSLVVDNTKPLTMSTLQIAELTGKNHKDVMRDFRNMVDSLEKGSKLVGGDERNFAPIGFYKETTYKDSLNRNKPMYELDEDLCNTLVMGYDAPLRFKIAKEWRLMKEGKANVPVNPYEHFEETDWIELALKKTRENKQLIELHVRKAIDTHSLSRLLGEKRGSTKVQMILKGLCAAGVLERRLDASGKPNGYDLLPPGYMFARMSAHGQIEFTADAIPHLVKLGLLEEEKAATLKLPQPNNSRAIINNTALLIRQNAGSLEHFGL